MNVTDTFKNRRTFFLGVNTGFVCDGVPDEHFLDFYRDRSSPDLHSAIIGNVVVPGGFGTNAQTPELSESLRWADVADAIARAGSIPGIQLATTWPDYVGQRQFVYRQPNEVIETVRQLIASMTRQDITDILNKFKHAAQLAVDHGYVHIQIHAAHGYLQNLLLDRGLNPLFSYAQEGMAKLADSLRTQKIETSLRWSMRTGDPDFDRNGILERFADIVPLQFEFVDLSSGYYNIDKRLIYPSTEFFISQRHADSLQIAQAFPEQRFIVSGKILNFSGDLPDNVDLGLCRDLIANPNFLKDWKNGCRNRGKCHYYSRDSDRLTCPIWGENSTVENR
jgi:NADPH2 dehydrogenase